MLQYFNINIFYVLFYIYYIYIADSPENSSECEEIDATQVIIHDSTPKTPVIQRRNRYVSCEH